MKAVLIPGDGIGREIAESVREVSAALNTGIESISSFSIYSMPL